MKGLGLETKIYEEPQGEMSRMYLGLDDWNEGDDFLCGDRDIFEEWE